MAGGSGSPFQIGESVELVRVITQLSILVALIMLLEVQVHHGSHKLNAHPKYHEVLTKVFTEALTIVQTSSKSKHLLQMELPTESERTSAPAAATATSTTNSTPSVGGSETPPLFSQTNVRKHEYWQFAKLIAPAHALPESKKAWTTDDAVGIWCLRCCKALPYQKGSSQSIRYHMETKHPAELTAFRDKVARIKESSSGGSNSSTVTSSPSASASSSTNGRGLKRKESPAVERSSGDSTVPMRLYAATPPLTMDDVVYIPAAPSAPPAGAVAPQVTAVAVPTLPASAAPVQTKQSDTSGADLTSWHRNVQRRSGFWGNAYWYDLQLCRRMPLAQPMLDELIIALPPCDSKRVIDLCAGSGRASTALLAAYPTAMVTLVDSSSERLGIAQKRLMDAGAIGNVQFVTKAISLSGESGSETITNSMPVDVVVGCLALHVLTEKPKHYEAEAGTGGTPVYSVEATYERIFGLIFNSLAPGGHLVFADHVGQLGLFKQLQLMASVGFVDVDCAWRQDDSFVAGGRRPVL